MKSAASVPLRLLHVEDSASDAELVHRALRDGGLIASVTRVQSAPEFLAAVAADPPPDVVLSDYSLPSFSGVDVLQLARAHCPEAPVIIVSGTIGEDRAAEILRQGATDYVLKDRLGRLASAVERALREAAERRVRRQLEAQLLQAQKMEAVGSLAGGVAHDFNNLLTVILGYGVVLKQRFGGDPEAVSILDDVLVAGERAATLTRQLLSFSRKQVLEPRVVDLNQVVREMESMLPRLIGEHIELACAPAPDLAPVRVDPGQIGQVIVNLAVNARDAMPDGGKLTIETANAEIDAGYAAEHAEVEPGHYVRLTVTDTGTGMDAETQRRIFEPFFTTKAPGEGTGLGLSTCYGIVRQSGGHIWVYSELGLGTSFKIYLPRAEGSAACELAPAAVATPPARSGETILLVEDEKPLRNLGRVVLESHGYRVLDAADGLAALALASAHAGEIKLLVTDVVMPGMSGPALAREAAQRIPGLRLLLMSGYADDAIVRHGVLAPGTAFIQKPFSPATLAHKVREVLDAAWPLP